MKIFYRFLFFLVLSFTSSTLLAQKIFVNQIGFNCNSPKTAVLGMERKVEKPVAFQLIELKTKRVVFEGKSGLAEQVKDWNDQYYYPIDFSEVKTVGTYLLRVKLNGKLISSATFQLAEQGLAELTIPSIIHYYHKQRANTSQELAADQHIILQGSTNTVDLTGGWCDASGDISKYFSHLAYTNFMSPQQIPLVT